LFCFDSRAKLDFSLSRAQMQDDIDDFGFIEIVKCWVEMHGVTVKQLKLNEFIIDGALIDCFQRAKNQLWRRLEFNLNVAPEVVHSHASTTQGMSITRLFFLIAN
jgi:hypothetical protein